MVLRWNIIQRRRNSESKWIEVKHTATEAEDSLQHHPKTNRIIIGFYCLIIANLSYVTGLFKGRGCPVCSHSAHVKKVYVVLKNWLRLIKGTIKSTPFKWQPVLANIITANIRRNEALAREVRKIYSDTSLPINREINGRSDVRLKSRKPIWIKINRLQTLWHDRRVEKSMERA